MKTAKWLHNKAYCFFPFPGEPVPEETFTHFCTNLILNK